MVQFTEVSMSALSKTTVRKMEIRYNQLKNNIILIFGRPEIMDDINLNSLKRGVTNLF